MRQIKLRTGLSALVLVVICLPLSAQIPNIYRIVIEACAGSSQRYAQSAFKLSGRSAIYTALHGVTGCKSLKAFDQKGAPAFGGQELKIVQADIAHDVAELATTEGLPTRAARLKRSLDAA